MADADYDVFADPDNGRGYFYFSPYINGLGAVLSLGLIGAVVVWGYQLAVRDVSGVPVIRALEGPMRVAPADPGGTAADYIGLSVNHVKAEGIAARPADRLVLAPAPAALEDDDQPVSTAQAETEVVSTDAGAREASVELSALLGGAEIETPEDIAVAQALAAAMLDEGAMGTVVDASAPSPQGPGLSISPRPMLRPVVARAVVAPVDLDPTGLPAGTRLVQLGAFSSEDEARSKWGGLSASYSDFFADKQRIIQRTETTGRVFFRLRAAGFEDLSDARRFCATILTTESTCIPVVVR